MKPMLEDALYDLIDGYPEVPRDVIIAALEARLHALREEVNEAHAD